MKKDYSEEIAYYKDFTYTCFHYIMSASAPTKFTEELLAVIEKIKMVQVPNTKAGLQGAMQGYYDILEISKDLPKDQFGELNKILIKKYGKDLNTEALRRQVEKITKRQRIKNDTEYYIIEEAVNELSQTNPTSEKIELCNSMLALYTKKQS